MWEGRLGNISTGTEIGYRLAQSLFD